MKPWAGPGSSCWRPSRYTRWDTEGRGTDVINANALILHNHFQLLVQHSIKCRALQFFSSVDLCLKPKSGPASSASQCLLWGNGELYDCIMYKCFHFNGPYSTICSLFKPREKLWPTFLSWTDLDNDRVEVKVRLSVVERWLNCYTVAWIRIQTSVWCREMKR